MEEGALHGQSRTSKGVTSSLCKARYVMRGTNAPLAYVPHRGKETLALYVPLRGKKM